MRVLALFYVLATLMVSVLCHIGGVTITKAAVQPTNGDVLLQVLFATLGLTTYVDLSVVFGVTESTNTLPANSLGSPFANVDLFTNQVEPGGTGNFTIFITLPQGKVPASRNVTITSGLLFTYSLIDYELRTGTLKSTLTV